MKFSFVFIFSLLCASVSMAQSTKGLTGKPDTSYSTYSAFRSTAKQYPDIRIVREKKFPSVKESRGLVYCRVGKRDLRIDAFQPAKKRSSGYPAVLIVHGGGWRSGNRTQHIPLAQHLADAGFASFTVEYRLSTEALYPAAVHDVKAALRWMRANAKKFNIDSSKIAITGFSAGGELAAFVGTTSGMARFEVGECNRSQSSDVQAIVDIDGTLSFVHPESGEGDDRKSTSAATYWFGYGKAENPDLWKDASPLTHAANNKAPVLFLNSSVERMHAGRDDFRKVLNANGVYSEVFTFENSPHSFCLFEPWFDPTVQHITRFLNQVFAKK
ncbi:MAG: alpha/beta hydrolase fold domain-containing protein [Arcticibacter sp.]